jgi:hypothetical protein
MDNVVIRFLVTGERARGLSIGERVRSWFSWAPAEVWGCFPGVRARRDRRRSRRRDGLIASSGQHRWRCRCSGVGV